MQTELNNLMAEASGVLAARSLTSEQKSLQTRTARRDFLRLMNEARSGSRARQGAFVDWMGENGEQAAGLIGVEAEARAALRAMTARKKIRSEQKGSLANGPTA